MSVRVAVVQMDCRLGEVQKNIEKIEALARKAGKSEPDVVCFPELATTGYGLNEKWSKFAEQVPGKSTERLARLAREHGFYLICGLDEQGSQGRIHDSAVLVDPDGAVKGVYRKVHLWDKERLYFTPGDHFKVFATRFGKIGIGICYDLEFPEPSRIMAVNGAELLFFPSAEPQPMRKMIETYVQSRASENCAFVAFSNRSGREGAMGFIGSSRIVTPLCKVLATVARAEEEGVAIADLDLSSLAKVRTLLPYLEQRLPATYDRLSV